MNIDVKEIEIEDYNILNNIKASLYRLWKLKLVVIMATIIGLSFSLIYTTLKGTEYSFYANATIYSAVYGSYSETMSGVTVMNTYSSILGTSRVCDRAAALINKPKITSSYLQSLVASGSIRLSGANSSSGKYGYKLDISTVLNKPDNVVFITNAMAKAFASEINELLGEDVVQVFDEATNSFMSTTSSNTLIILICAFAGFFISSAIIVVKEFFSSKVQIISQCISDKDLLLGAIPINK